MNSRRNCRLKLALFALAKFSVYARISADYHTSYSPLTVKMGKKMLYQVVQVKETRWRAFAPYFVGVWLAKNFSSQGLLFGGLWSAVIVQASGYEAALPAQCRSGFVNHQPFSHITKYDRI